MSATIKWYNLKQASLQLDTGWRKPKGQIILAKSLAKSSFKPKAGDKIYDWNNKLVFSISPEEACLILRWFNALKTKDPTKDKVDALSLSHSPSGNMKQDYKNLTFNPGNDGSGKWLINVTISDNTGNKITFTLSKDRIIMFMDWLDFVKRLYIVHQIAEIFAATVYDRRETHVNRQTQNPTRS